MLRRVALTVTALSVAVQIAVTPASASSFAPQSTVASGCIPTNYSTAGTTGGALRIFVRCSSGQDKLITGDGRTWRAYTVPTKPPYHGGFLGAASDETGDYLLYSNPGTVELVKRFANGTWSSPTVLSRRSAALGWGAITARAGRWWAVWSEEVSRETNTVALFEAHSMLTPQARHQITSPASGVQDRYPSIASRPGGGVVLAWARVRPGGDDGRGTPTARMAVRSGTAWRSNDLDPSAARSDWPTVVTNGTHLFFGWNRAGQPVVATDESGTLVRRQLRGNGCALNVVPGISRGRLVVGYHDCTADHRVGTIAVQLRGTSAWAGETLWNGNYLFGGVLSRDGKATVFVARDTEPFATWARTQA